MERNKYTMRNIEKHIKNFHKKISECKDCYSKKGLKRYFDKKDTISNQRKIYYENNKFKLIEKQNGRYIYFKK